MIHGSFEFGVLVNDKPVREYFHDQRVYIEGRDTSSFEMFFTNNTLEEVLVQFSVDGISPTDGSQVSPDSIGIVVDAKTRIKIPGWIIDSGSVGEFVFANTKANSRRVDLTTLNNGVIGCIVYAKQPAIQHIVPEMDNLGVGVRMSEVRRVNKFSQSFGNNEPKFNSTNLMAAPSWNSINPLWQTSLNSGSPSMNVEWGKKVSFDSESTEFERGHELTRMVIRYDTRKGLMDRGVIQRTEKQQDPNPFPGYGCTPPKGWNG